MFIACFSKPESKRALPNVIPHNIVAKIPNYREIKHIKNRDFLNSDKARNKYITKSKRATFKHFGSDIALVFI